LNAHERPLLRVLDGGLDEAGLRAHLGRLGDAGIGVYLAGSGSGEGYTLDDGEVELHDAEGGGLEVLVRLRTA